MADLEGVEEEQRLADQELWLNPTLFRYVGQGTIIEGDLGAYPRWPEELQLKEESPDPESFFHDAQTRAILPSHLEYSREDSRYGPNWQPSTFAAGVGSDQFNPPWADAQRVASPTGALGIGSSHSRETFLDSTRANVCTPFILMDDGEAFAEAPVLVAASVTATDTAIPRLADSLSLTHETDTASRDPATGNLADLQMYVESNMAMANGRSDLTGFSAENANQSNRRGGYNALDSPFMPNPAMNSDAGDSGLPRSMQRPISDARSEGESITYQSAGMNEVQGTVYLPILAAPARSPFLEVPMPFMSAGQHRHEGTALEFGSKPSSPHQDALPSGPLRAVTVAPFALGQRTAIPLHKCSHKGCNHPGFVSRDLLRHHLDTHKEDKKHRYKCPEPGCQNPGFRYPKDVRRHLSSASVHSEPDIPCPRCQDLFGRGDHLKRHTKTCTGRPSKRARTQSAASSMAGSVVSSPLVSFSPMNGSAGSPAYSPILRSPPGMQRSASDYRPLAITCTTLQTPMRSVGLAKQSFGAAPTSTPSDISFVFETPSDGPTSTPLTGFTSDNLVANPFSRLSTSHQEVQVCLASPTVQKPAELFYTSTESFMDQ